MWGKSLLDESSPNFLGIYAGSASAPNGAHRDRRGAGAGHRRGGVHRHGQWLLQPADRPGPDHRRRPVSEQCGRRSLRAVGNGRRARGAGHDPGPPRNLVAAGGVAARRTTAAAPAARPTAHPEDVVGPPLRSAHTGQCGARRPGHVLLRHGRPSAAAGRHLHRPTTLGLNRLHAARRARGGGGASGPQDGVADRRRGRATDRPRARHLLRARGCPRSSWWSTTTATPSNGRSTERRRRTTTSSAGSGPTFPTRWGSPTTWRSGCETYGELDDALTAAARASRPHGVRRGRVAAARNPATCSVELVQPISPDGSPAPLTQSARSTALRSGLEDRRMAWTVRRQRPQSAPAPHAWATSLVVDAPHATASVTVWLVTPLHRHTNTGESSVRLDAHHVEESADEQRRVGADARRRHPLRRGIGMVDPLAARFPRRETPAGSAPRDRRRKPGIPRSFGCRPW